MATGDDLIGHSFGGYRIEDVIGQGGMAVVYRAHEASLKRTVALKVIADDLAAEPEFIERFRREAQAAASLVHPNIVQIYSCGEHDGRFYFAMEYVAGQTLGDLMDDRRRLAVDEALPIIEQIASALGAAHAAGIVHRDIKPANIMVDNVGRVRVADFGIAQIENQTGLTATGVVIGTPDYMAPEQCDGERPDARTDIYSLGVTFYHALAGRTPFDARTTARLLVQILQGHRVPLRVANPAIPAPVRDVIEKMIATAPDQRYRSAQELLTALATAKASLGNHPASASIPPTIAAVDVAAPPPEERTVTPRTPPNTTGLLIPPTVGVEEWSERDSPPEAEEPRPSAVTSPPAGVGAKRGPAVAAIVVLVTLLTLAVALAGRPAGEPHEVQDEIPQRQDDDEELQAKQDALRLAEETTRRVQEQLRLDEARIDAEQEQLRAREARLQGEREDLLRQQQELDAQAQEDQGPQVFPAPAPSSVVTDVTGDHEFQTEIGDLIDAELLARGYEVVDFAATGATRLDQVARIHVLATIRSVGAEDLEYFGQRTTQYTATLSIRAIDPNDGNTLARPVTESIRYTMLNRAENLRAATRRATRSVLLELARRRE